VLSAVAAGDCELSAHDRQADASVAPFNGWYVSAAQFVHVELAGLYDAASLYVPWGHIEQKAPSAPKYPALHLQSVPAPLPA